MEHIPGMTWEGLEGLIDNSSILKKTQTHTWNMLTTTFTFRNDREILRGTDLFK